MASEVVMTRVLKFRTFHAGCLRQPELSRVTFDVPMKRVRKFGTNLELSRVMTDAPVKRGRKFRASREPSRATIDVPMERGRKFGPSRELSRARLPEARFEIARFTVRVFWGCPN